MNSLLPPREIQSRIRGGESLDDVAAAAQAPVERIMAYAVPVLAERAHLAQLAQRSSVRGAPADGGPRTLEEWAEARLRPAGVEPASVEWDAWRRVDRRWTLVADLTLDGVPRRATFVYDHAGRYVLPEDDAARWLVGESEQRPGEAAAEEGLAPVRPLASAFETVAERTGAVDAAVPVEPPTAPSSHDRAREQAAHDLPSSDLADLTGASLGAPGDGSGVDAPEEQGTLGEDAIALVTGRAADPAPRGWQPETEDASWLGGGAADDAVADPEPGQDLTAEPEDPESPWSNDSEWAPREPDEDTVEIARGPASQPARDLAPEPGAEEQAALFEPSVAAPPAEPAPEAAPASDAGDAGDVEAGDSEAATPVEEPAPRRSRSRRKGRASIPSWDEIMFGADEPAAEPDPDADPGSHSA